MAELKQFKYFVTLNQDQLSLVALCTKCAMSTMLTVVDNAPLGVNYSLKQHTCYGEIVSVPAGEAP